MSYTLQKNQIGSYVFGVNSYKLQYIGMDYYGPGTAVPARINYATNYNTGAGWATVTLPGAPGNPTPIPPTAKIYISDETSKAWDTPSTPLYVFAVDSLSITFDFVDTPPPPPPPPPTTGSLNITTYPSGARVYIDGVDQRVTTPSLIQNITAGQHTVNCIIAGYQQSSNTVYITQGTTQTLNISLTPNPPTTGSISISSTPMGAEIYINGIDQSVQTTATVNNVTPGSHVVTLKKTGYTDFVQTVNVIAGSNTDVQATLTPVPTTGSINISSTPTGAEIYIDGIDQGVKT